MPDSIDIRVYHQRVNETQDQHDPERCVWIKKEKAEKIREMKKAGQRRYSIPASVSKEFRVGGRAINPDRVRGSHRVGVWEDILFEDFRRLASIGAFLLPTDGLGLIWPPSGCLRSNQR